MNKKKLMEDRAAALEEMQKITDNATKVGQRTLNADEQSKIKELTDRIASIDATIAAMEQTRSLQKDPEPETPENKMPKETDDQIELRTFANIVRERADQNITKGSNGAVIPKTIVSRIIDKVQDISPLFGRAASYNVKGTVSIPYVDADADTIAMTYADEFTAIAATGANLKSIDLTGYLSGALAKVSTSLLNASDIDLTNFVIDKIAEAIAVFFDHETIVGTSGKITGLSTATDIITAAAATAVTGDELIQLQGELKSQFQTNAIWVMNPKTLTAVRQLKDGDRRYLFNNDITTGFSGMLLGKPVFTSDQCPAMAAGAKCIYYIDAGNALAKKMVEETIQVLRERYADQHCLGVIAWTEADVKLVNQQAAAVLQMAAS